MEIWYICEIAIWNVWFSFSSKSLTDEKVKQNISFNISLRAEKLYDFTLTTDGHNTRMDECEVNNANVTEISLFMAV